MENIYDFLGKHRKDRRYMVREDETDYSADIASLKVRMTSMETAVRKLQDRGIVSKYILTMVLDASGEFLVASAPYDGTITNLNIVYPPYRANTSTQYTLYIGIGSVMTFLPQVSAIDNSGSFNLDLSITQGSVIKLYRVASEIDSGDLIPEHELGSWSASLVFQTNAAVDEDEGSR